MDPKPNHPAFESRNFEVLPRPGQSFTRQGLLHETAFRLRELKVKVEQQEVAKADATEEAFRFGKHLEEHYHPDSDPPAFARLLVKGIKELTSRELELAEWALNGVLHQMDADMAAQQESK